MKNKPMKKKLKIAGVVLLMIVFIAGANFLAGAILFASFKENPTKAEFLTIERAYVSANDNITKKKINISIGLSFLLCVLAPFALLMRVRPKGSNLYGHARFADMDDIKQEKLDTKRGVVIGKFNKELLRLGGYEFVLLAAPTRTGKGVGFCVPNLLQFQDSAVVLDIKGENYNLTSEFRRRYMGNEIVYFNPFSENTMRWNPLSYVSKNPSFRANDLMAIATIIYPVNEKDPFWSDAAKNLFVGLGLLVLETPELPKTIGEILRQGSGKGNAIDTYLNHVLTVRAASDNPLSAACRDSLNRFLGSGETALKGIVATFSATLTPFANDVIDKATSGDDFDLRDVRKKKMTIYLHIPAGEILQATFIVNLFFSQLINENVKELPEQNPDLKYQCLLLLDEFTAMGKVAIIAKGVGYMAGYNMRLAIIIQDKTQLDSVYGKEDAHNIVSNMGAVIYFTPSQISEAEEYSKMIGNNTVLSDSLQHAKGTLLGLKGNSGDSRTESFQSRAVMLPQELLSMSKDTQLVVRSGIPVIKADKIRYFEDEYFKERFNAVPMHQVTIGGESRKVPIPAKLPVGDWLIYRESVQHSDYYLRQEAPSNQAPDNSIEAQPQVQEPSNSSATVETHSPLPSPSSPEFNDYQLPELPKEFEPFDALYARLSVPFPCMTSTSHVAKVYSESIIRYWQMQKARGAIDHSAPLTVLDLSPGDGQFSWQFFGALRERLATVAPHLPWIQYVACADDANQLAAIQSHPYFEDFLDGGSFVTMLREDLFNSEEQTYAGNPVAVIAHGLLSRLKHEMLAIHYGEMFRVEAMSTTPSNPTSREIQLEYKWPAVLPDDLSASGKAVMSMYGNCATSVVVSLPTAAMICVDRIAHVTGERFLFLSADPAIVDERDLRLGAYSPPASLAVPAHSLLANYHALAFHMRANGHSVWQEQMPDTNIGFCVALGDRENIDMADLLPPLRTAHTNEQHRVALLAQSREMALPDYLYILQIANFDPSIFNDIFPVLEKSAWNISTVARDHWQDALRRVWSLYLPTSNGTHQCEHISLLALKLRDFELTIQAARQSLIYEGETVDNLIQLAEAEMRIGRLLIAKELAEKVCKMHASHEKAISMRDDLTACLQLNEACAWYRADHAQVGSILIEPLAKHHAEQLLYEYRDRQIGVMTMLPQLETLEETRHWIATEMAQPSNISCAILHETWGLIGFVSVQRTGNFGYFSIWIGTDHQGRGNGETAAKIMCDMLQGSSITDMFSATYKDNHRAINTLEATGFNLLEIKVKSPYQDLQLFHVGTLHETHLRHEAFESLCKGLSIPFVFESANPDAIAMALTETVPEELETVQVEQ